MISALTNSSAPRASRRGRLRPTSRRTGHLAGGRQNGWRQQLPKVSIVILTAVGTTHIRECLASLRAAKLSRRITSKSSSSTTALSRIQPTRCMRIFRALVSFETERISVLRPATTSGADVATGEYLVFLNDDTRAHQEWLRELVGSARRRGAAAVSSCILDWSGQAADFVESAVNFEGKGFQLHYGTPINGLSLTEKPLLFGCGGALLIDRAVFRDAGGWDDKTFASYRDVELGWRLNLFGHEVWFAPRAVVYHKHHGTSARWPEPPRIRLYERNALRNLYGLLDSDALRASGSGCAPAGRGPGLFSTGLNRASESSSQSARQRLIRSVKAAFRARKISRATPIRHAIRGLGIRGFFGVPRDIVRLFFAKQSRSRREAYLIEQGGVPVTFDSWREPIPIDAAAILAGVYAFLSDLPRLTHRRAELQRRRSAPISRCSGVSERVAVAVASILSGRTQRASRHARRRICARGHSRGPNGGSCSRLQAVRTTGIR